MNTLFVLEKILSLGLVVQSLPGLAPWSEQESSTAPGWLGLGQRCWAAALISSARTCYRFYMCLPDLQRLLVVSGLGMGTRCCTKERSALITRRVRTKGIRLCKVSACCCFPLLSKFNAASADVCPKALQLSLEMNGINDPSIRWLLCQLVSSHVWE